MKRRRYTAEFKRDAVHLLIMEGQSAKDVSEKLGINVNMLNRWKREQFEGMDPAPDAGEGSPAEMAEEIARLRKELARAGRINEILKKTVGYFAKDES